MELKVFGALALEENAKKHKTPYIALLAICYLAIEGKTERKKLIDLIQAADKDRTSQMLRGDDSSKGESIENYDVAANNFRQNFFKLKRKLDSGVMPIVDDGEYFTLQDGIYCEYNQVLDLFDSDAASQQKAVSLYEKGLFLDNFEVSYPKRHFEVAEALKNWIDDKRQDILKRYLAIKPEHNTQALNLDTLKLQLPENSGAEASNITAQTLLMLLNADFEPQQKSKCIQYIQDYIPIHLRNLSIEDEDNTVKLLFAIYSFEQQDFQDKDQSYLQLIKNNYEISDDSYETIIEDLNMNEWLDEETQIPSNNGPLQDAIKGYFSQHAYEYYDLIHTFSKALKPKVFFDLLSHFLKSHNPVPEELLDSVSKVVNQCCHELIRLQEYEDALMLSDLLLRQLPPNQEATETHFWHVYALEQSREYARAKEFFASFKIPREPYELQDRLNGVKASVLARSSEGREDMTEARALLDKILRGDSKWALAEAYNTLGVIELKTNESNFFKVQSYFNKAAIGWEFLGESIRHVMTLSNLAVVFDRNEEIEEAEQAYDKAIKLAQEYEVNDTVRVNVLQNKFVFYHDCIKFELVDEPQQFIELSEKLINELLKAVAKKDISPGAHAGTIFSIAKYYEYLHNITLASEYLREALKISQEGGENQLVGLVLVELGTLEKDYDKIEEGIRELIRAGFDEDAKWCVEDYVDHLKNEIEQTKTVNQDAKELQFRLESIGELYN